jgi:hypothetical protein
MIHRDVFECGAFTELPDRAKILYLYLCINADDDGFVDKIPALLRSQKCTVRHLEALVENGFLFRFSKDLIVIRHWKKHNAISPKNHRPTIYQKELSTLCLDRHKIYQEKTEKKPTEYTEEKTEEKTEEVTEKEVVREKADATATDGSSVEIKEGYTCTKDDVEEYCLKLPRYKRPREIIFAHVPRNATGKIEKPRLREEYGATNLVAAENQIES